jgi:hypothetical protein
MKGDEQLTRAVMAESGWYHGARKAFVPEAGWRLLFFEAVWSPSERDSPSLGRFCVAAHAPQGVGFLPLGPKDPLSSLTRRGVPT